jgi:hypothetical protein
MMKKFARTVMEMEKSISFTKTLVEETWISIYPVKIVINMIDFETMVKKQEEIENLKSCIKGLKLYFDYANIDITKFVKKHGMKKYKKFQAGLEYMFNNFKDE